MARSTRLATTPFLIHPPASIISNPSEFLDHEWIDIPNLEKFLARNVSGTDAVAFTTHPSSEQDLISRLSAHEVMSFRNYMYAQCFIESDAAQILNLDWIDVPALRKFLDQKISIETPHVSEPNTPSFSVKSEPQPISLSRGSGAVKLRTLKQGGREILELISESEAYGSDPDFDVEVTTALMRVSSRSSSTIAQSDAMDTKYRGPNDGDTLWQDEMKGHRYFVACSGLTTKLQGKHRKHTIPDDVDENLLARLLAPASSSEPSGRDQIAAQTGQ
ncbi:hypothetical protein B0H13DRAFT_1956661 [Mycena leptocephala]|nr:hypothetical protein B0H13DRAFT_1956661 [Mycena leptocephala]